MAREHSDRIPCSSEIPCKYRVEDECFEDIHHEAYPKPDYRKGIEKKFRDHIMNKVLMCRAMHDEEHAQHLPPQKPPQHEMRRLIEEWNQ